MDEDLTRHYRRWREADAHDRDDEADAACAAMFEDLGRETVVAPDFTARTLAAVAAAAEQDRQRARRARQASVAGGVAAAGVGVYAGGPWMLSAFSTLLVSAIDLIVRLTVAMASGMEAGTDVWSVFASLGRALAAFVTNPAVTAAIFAMQGIAMAALIALHRLLGSDRESLK